MEINRTNSLGGGKIVIRRSLTTEDWHLGFLACVGISDPRIEAFEVEGSEAGTTVSVTYRLTPDDIANIDEYRRKVHLFYEGCWELQTDHTIHRGMVDGREAPST